MPSPTKSTFKMRVYALAAKIPRSKVATYGQLARLAGNPKAARAVGSLMKYNPDKKIIPCHRVVAQDGKLTGYSFGRGIATKRSVLIKEGVSFLGDRIDLSISGWRRGKKL